MQIWRAKSDQELFLYKGYFTGKYMLATAHKAERIARIFKGKAYAVYDCDPYSGGYFEVILFKDSGGTLPIMIDSLDIHKLFKIDLIATEMVNTKK